MLELMILDKGPEITGDDNFRIDEFIESRPGALQGLRCEMRFRQLVYKGRESTHLRQYLQYTTQRCGKQ